MKKLFFVLTIIIGVTVTGLTGCKKSGSVDTAKVESAFQAVASADKAEVEKAVSAAKSGDYAGALASLSHAAHSMKLTPEQKSAIEDLVNQLTEKIAAAAKEAMDGAGKTAEDLKKSLPKP